MPRKSEKTNKSDLRGHFGFHVTPFSRELPIAERWRTSVFDEPLTELLRVVEHAMSGALIAPASGSRATKA